MWMRNLDADRTAMYFCVAAACLFELMFIVRAPGRTWPGACAYTGKHIVVVMLLSAIKQG